jgi:hypothetical protein
MTIANPIYDIVFKYLMEDLDIAKGLLSTILNTEIVSLSVQPQEAVAETNHNDIAIRIFRIDFAAIIKETDGSTRKILIELQKTKRSTNISRFRRYLAENYSKEDIIIKNGVETKESLEIVTIYFLGFDLDTVDAPVLYVKNDFIDVINGGLVTNAAKEDFVRLLTHESYMIQLKKLPPTTKTRLERVLKVFNQTYKLKDDHKLEIIDEDDDPLVQKMCSRLTRAIADEQMRKKMDIEDEIDQEFQAIDNKYVEQFRVQALEMRLTQAELKETQAELQEKDNALQEKDRTLQAVQEALKAQAEMIAELKKRLDNNQ